MSRKQRAVSRAAPRSRLTANCSPAVVAIDIGGTWLRLIAADAHGRRLLSLKQPAPSLHQLPTVLRRLLQRKKIAPHELRVASRGVWKSAPRKKLSRALRGLAPRITVISDVEAAWYAAFSGQRGGILVISGTGSIALGRKGRGPWKRAGGLGPEKSDEGSGYWIGKQWLGVRSGSVRTTAALAPSVIQKARRDPRALAIVTLARGELASLLIDVSRQLHWKGPLPVSWAGSVLENDFFRAGFQRMVEARWPGRVQWRPSRETAVEALLRRR